MLAVGVGLCLLAAGVAGANSTYITESPIEPATPTSIAVGSPTRGALIFGVQLPPEGTDHFTWDFPLGVAPNRDWRRWGTGGTIERTLAVIAEHRLANFGAPRVGIADLSREAGGPFGKRFGGLGHASHQNGLDVDVLYPRADHLERAAPKAKLIDRAPVAGPGQPLRRRGRPVRLRRAQHEAARAEEGRREDRPPRRPHPRALRRGALRSAGVLPIGSGSRVETSRPDDPGGATS